MLRLAAFLFIFCLVVSGGLSHAIAEKRVALVIGNSAYEHAPELKNPKNDAAAMSAVLEELGFDVVTGTDLSHASFAQTVNTFRKKLQGADVGLFFYAGHGLQVHGQNYLAPIDAELENETSLDFEAIPLHVVLRLMERSTKTNLVFLDACRDNPLARNLARSMGTRSTAIGRGLAREETGLGTMISFATQPGNVALDGEGNNSPFATGMLKHIETPGMDVALVMRRVREDVIKATSGSQVPWSNSSLTGSFTFRSAPKTEGVAPVATPQPYNPKATELAFWQSISGSKNAALFEEYLNRYPTGDFSLIAKTKLEDLKKAEQKQKEEKVAALTKSVPAEPEQLDITDPGELTRALQRELKRVGCDPGAIDGVWGKKGRNALARFNRYAKLTLPTNEPTVEAIRKIKNESPGVCSNSPGSEITRTIDSCHALANTASFEKWPAGTVALNRVVRGMHPCGRRIECKGGDFSRGILRRCRWL